MKTFAAGLAIALTAALPALAQQAKPAAAPKPDTLRP